MDLLTAATIIITSIGIAVSVSVRKVLVARAQSRGALDAQTVLARLDALDARLAALERAAEVNTLELERIGETQRFLAREVGDVAGSRPDPLQLPEGRPRTLAD